MYPKFFKVLLQILILANLLLVNFLGTTAVYAATPTINKQLNQSLIKPDGTIDLMTGYSGNLDITNYDVVLDPVRGPILKPLMAGSTWGQMGTNVGAEVRAIVVNGADIYIGGEFTQIGGNGDLAYIAKWSNGNWAPMNNGLNGTVLAIAVSGTDVYAGGIFSEINGNKDYIAKWNGTVWSALGSVPLDNAVWAIAAKGTDVYVGGAFQNAGGNANADNFAKWDGTTSTWSALGTVPMNGAVSVIVVNPSNNDVYVGGTFTDAGGDVNADRVAKWNGSSWSALGAGLNNSVLALAISGTNIYAGGNFLDAGGAPTADYFAKWNGTAWVAMGTTLNSIVTTISVSAGVVYIGGAFTDAGGNANADHVAKWNGTNWSPLGIGLSNDVGVVVASGTTVYAGGIFDDTASVNLT